MKLVRGPLLCLLAFAPLALGVAGCGPRKVKVYGKLTQGAKPLRGTEEEPIRVAFTPYDENKPSKGPVYLATVDQATATYEVVVPVGRYRICVSQFTANLSDRFDNAFGEGFSPIVRDVTEDGPLDLDLNKPIS
jgi:hypothetical protein